MSIIADYLAENRLHEENAAALLSLVAKHLAGNSVLDMVLLDPAASARTGAVPTAEAEYQRIFGRRVRRWPLRGVVDSLSLVESLLGGDQREPGLLVHRRCEATIAAFYGYERASRSGLREVAGRQATKADFSTCARK
jgi:hypothetical protein